MMDMQKVVWLMILVSNKTASTGHHVTLYPSTGEPSHTISHHYESTDAGNMMTPHMDTTRYIDALLTHVDAYNMTSVWYPDPMPTTSIPNMASAVNETPLGPPVRLTCYSCSGTGCGQKRQHYDPLRRCGADELCYLEMINHGMMSVYERGCATIHDVACHNVSSKLSCRQSRRDEICRICCSSDKCNSMPWKTSNTSTSLSPVLATVIAVILVMLM